MWQKGLIWVPSRCGSHQPSLQHTYEYVSICMSAGMHRYLYLYIYIYCIYCMHVYAHKYNVASLGL